MARIQWNPLQQTPINMGFLEAANQGMMGGIKSISDALIGVGTQYRNENTNRALQQVLGINSLDDLNTQRTAIADSVAAQGQSVDALKVLEALGAQQDALTRRENANVALQSNQIALGETQKGIADQSVINAALQDLASGNNTAAMERLSQIQGNASPLFSAIRGEQRYDTEWDYKKQQDLIDNNMAIERLNLDKRSSDRADLSSSVGLANYLNPNPGQTTVEAVVNPTTGATEYVTRTAPSAASTLSTVMSSLFNTESNGVHRTGNGQLLRSSAGALGVAQIMPSTAAKPGYGMQPINLEKTTPEQQQQWATEYISRIGSAHKFSIPEAVAAYNAGPGAVSNAKAKANAKGGSGNFLDYLPAETKAYVPKVLGSDWSSLSNTPMDQITSGSGQSTKQQPIPKTIARQAGQVSEALGGIPINAKTLQGIQQEYTKATQSIGKSNTNLPKSPLDVKATTQDWLYKNRNDTSNSNTVTRLFNFTDADDIYKTAMKNKAFSMLNEDKKVKILDNLLSYSKNNQGIAYKNPGDFDYRINKLIIDDAKVTKQLNNAKRVELLNTSANKIIASLGLPPNAIAPEKLYPLLDPQWAKKNLKGKDTVANPFN